jgi:hypothetical protein
MLFPGLACWLGNIAKVEVVKKYLDPSLFEG